MGIYPSRQIFVPPTLFPKANDIRKRTRKMTNRILTIDAAPAAIPPKPKTAAMMAIMRKVTDQRSILVDFKFDNNVPNEPAGIEYNFMPD